MEGRTGSGQSTLHPHRLWRRLSSHTGSITPLQYNGNVKKSPPRTGRSAMFVAAGILVSRLAGLVRTRFFAHYFGLSAEGDAFAAGFRIPNFLQSLFRSEERRVGQDLRC